MTLTDVLIRIPTKWVYNHHKKTAFLTFCGKVIQTKSKNSERISSLWVTKKIKPLHYFLSMDCTPDNAINHPVSLPTIASQPFIKTKSKYPRSLVLFYDTQDAMLWRVVTPLLFILAKPRLFIGSKI